MAKKEAIKISVIIPTYNEKENISKLIPKVSKALKKFNGNIIVVDDNSPDLTGNIAEKLSKKYPVKVIHRFDNKGYGNSVKEGMINALKSDIIITMDCDFSHDPEVISFMVSEIQKGYDVVIGSRRVNEGKINGWSLWRHFCSSGAMKLSRFMLNLKTRDVTSGFRAYKKEVIKNIPFDNIKSNGYAFLEEILFYVEQEKYRVSEIPITFLDRRKGKSKLSYIEIIKFFITIFNLKIKLMLKTKTFFKFILVGLSGIFVNMFALWFLASILDFPVWIAGIIAIESSVMTNFFINDHWTFAKRKKHSSKTTRFFKYQVSVLLGISINYFVLLGFTEILKFPYMLSNIIGIMFSTLSNYFFSSRWAWRENES